MSQKRLAFRTNRGTQFGPKPSARAQMYDVAAVCAREGAQAFVEGVHDNPYPTGSVNERAWREAYELAKERAERSGTIIL